MAAVKGELDDGLVVAYCAYVAGIGIAPEIHKCCRAGAKGIASAGVRVDEVEVNLSFSRKAFLSLRAHWMLSQHRTRLEHLDSFGPNLAGNIRAGLELKAHDLVPAAPFLPALCSTLDSHHGGRSLPGGGILPRDRRRAENGDSH